MLKIISPSHCFQPPTPEAFSPLLTPDVVRRIELIEKYCGHGRDNTIDF
ncbi:hypothetical protein RGQ29_024225 [Quercus rubra]|uniref:Uncharacterized protein n=1 Tax=Quercus rubra TaxID=3512 RepID=A0AAN7F868_QUERU|nr:hypothetical protein RGQ29_024225 [Quercus rubra]